MPEIRLRQGDTAGWPGALRRDLPAYNRYGQVQDNEMSQQPVVPMRAAGGGNPALGMPAARNPVYRYIDTDNLDVSPQHILWSDSASWCTMISLWRMGLAGLAHVVPGNSAADEAHRLMDLFAAQPTEIHMVTMPQYYGKADGFQSVLAAVRHHYGQAYPNIKVYLIDGYAGRPWEQKHQLAVDPKAGAYPVFN